MVAEGNVGVAFGLVAAAGMATTLGACIVFCASLAQPRLLAASLGFAAGVMLYVSFAEILMRKSIAGFEAVSNGDIDAAFRWSTLCFFGGMAVIALLDRVVHVIAHIGAKRSQRKAAACASVSTATLLSHEEQREAQQRRAASAPPPRVATMQRGSPSGTAGGSPRTDVEQPGSAANSPRKDGTAAAGSLAGSQEGHLEGHEAVEPGLLTEPCDAVTSVVVAASCPETVVGAGAEGEDKPVGAGGVESSADAGTTSRTPPAVVEIMEADHHSFMLKKMGLLTALAIFIHNFPEGLATFVGALADTKVGVGLAVAIAMHNIPEGICVAMPIYYATGSRWKGFMWAFLSGVSEPVGGLVGYLALSGSSELSFAIVFGLVAGMMVYISVKELIPTALRYDPKDTVATTSVIAGMAVMAASLLLFTL